MALNVLKLHKGCSDLRDGPLCVIAVSTAFILCDCICGLLCLVLGYRTQWFANTKITQNRVYVRDVLHDLNSRGFRQNLPQLKLVYFNIEVFGI